MDNKAIRPRPLPVLRLFSRNPLIRARSRMETAVVALAVSVVVVAAACAAVLGTMIYHAEMQNYRDQVQTRHEVVATAVDDSKAPVSPDTSTFSVDARWEANGTTHTGAVGSDDAVKAGDRLQIWIDADGNPVARPAPPELAGPEAVIAAVAAWFIMVLAATPVLALVRANARDKREAQWDEDIRSLVEDGGGRTNTPQC
jgi:hypothetical protein